MARELWDLDNIYDIDHFIDKVFFSLLLLLLLRYNIF